jgi:hypothetical protein
MDTRVEPAYDAGLCGAAYFGRTLGSPPGLPGGGITGVLLVSVFGVAARIAGSTLLGGHRTPSDFASLSPSGSAPCPVVAPFGVIVPWALVCVGAQFASARVAEGGAVGAGGVVGVGGAWAKATLEPAIARPAMRSVRLMFIPGKPGPRRDVPRARRRRQDLM